MTKPKISSSFADLAASDRQAQHGPGDGTIPAPRSLSLSVEGDRSNKGRAMDEGCAEAAAAAAAMDRHDPRPSSIPSGDGSVWADVSPLLEAACAGQSAVFFVPLALIPACDARGNNARLRSSGDVKRSSFFMLGLVICDVGAV